MGALMNSGECLPLGMVIEMSPRRKKLNCRGDETCTLDYTNTSCPVCDIAIKQAEQKH